MLKDNSRHLLFWIAGIGFLTYIWTVFFGFIYFDDQELILNNLYFLKNLANIPTAFVTDAFRVLHTEAAYYRPLLTISFMFDALFSGASPFFYHLTNILIHITSSCVLFIFLQKIKLKREISFLFSIIFTVHPALSQTIAWIPARDDSLLTLFSLLSFIFFLKYFESGKAKDIVWHIVFFGAAVFTKESGIFIAPLIVLYLLLFERKNLLSRKLNVVFYWIGVFGIWLILRSFALQEPVKYSLKDSIRGIYMGLPAIILDLGKVIFPINLSILPTVQDSTFIWGIASTLLIILILVFSKNKNNKLILFGFAWFFLFLLPAFIRPGTGYEFDFFEYRIYMPIIGLFMVLSEVSFVKKFNFSSKKWLLFLGILTLLLIVLNTINTSKYRNRLVLWQSAVLTSPHLSLAHKNLGAMYHLDGQLDKAETEYKKSLELNANETMIHNNLGLIYASKEDFDKAEDEYKKELEINPNYSNALFNYGNLLYVMGKTQEAEKMWIQTLRVNPDYTDAIKNLFILYYQNKDYNQAEYYYTELQKRGINLQ